MDRLFLDANVLFSAAYSPNSGLAQFSKLDRVTLCSSRYAVEEARSNLATAPQRERLRRLSAKIELFDALDLVDFGDVALPAKDRPILLAAIAARATHLITGDLRHFGSYFGKSVRGILIVRPADYLKFAAAH